MKDQLVYHYTTFESFLSIVESNSLWASDLDAVNDPSELWNARQLLHDVLAVHSARGATLSLAMQRATGLTHLPSSWKFAGTSHLPYERFAEGAADYLREPSAESHWNSAIGHIFGVSFCRMPDLLSQWRAYGLNGSGVCVGFDRRKLAGGFETVAEIVDVNYDKKAQVQRVLDIMRPAFDRYETEMKHLDSSFFTKPEATEGPSDQTFITIAGWEGQRRSPEEREIIESCVSDVLSSLSAIAHTFKLNAFQEEKEVRLVFKSPTDGSKLAPMKLRARGNELIPYVEMKPTTGILPIQRVIVGPASRSFGQAYALMNHLTHSGHVDVQIEPSRFALR